MSDYSNDNRGVLFKNDKKESENHPDYKGRIDIDGTEYWLSAWIKKTKDGKTYMSLSRGDEIYTPSGDTVVTEISDDPIDLKDIPF